MPWDSQPCLCVRGTVCLSPSRQAEQRQRQRQSPPFHRARSRGPERPSCLLGIAQEFVRTPTSGLTALGSLYEPDKPVPPSRLVWAGPQMGWETAAPVRVFPGGFSGLGAQPPLKNMCFLFSFSLWLGAENKAFLIGRASQTWPGPSRLWPACLLRTRSPSPAQPGRLLAAVSPLPRLLNAPC